MNFAWLKTALSGGFLSWKEVVCDAEATAWSVVATIESIVGLKQK